MSKKSALFLCLCGASLMIFCQPSVLAKDGSFVASAMGRNGDVNVETVIKNGKIAGIKILDWSETHPIADLPKVQIPEEIIKNQSVNVDNVSGATLTSFAIKGAVREALKQAGLDVTAFSKKVLPPKKLTGTVEKTAQVVIIGAGGAGLSAAVAAAEAGANVIVVEKSHYAGGNTSVAGGNFNAADLVRSAKFELTAQRRKIVESILNEKPKNRLQAHLIAKVKDQLKAFDAAKEKKLFDSPEFHALQTWKGGDYQGDLELVYNLTTKAPQMEKDLEKMGFVWRKNSEQVMGSLWPRANRSANYASGVGFIETFLNEIQKKKLPVTLLLNTKAEDLIVKNGRVVGVKCLNSNGQTYVINATKGVILASGGFGANVDMRVHYDTIWDKKLGNNVNTTNVPSIQGDGMNMAERVGARLVQMGNIQLLPTTDAYTGSSNSKVNISTSVFVNKDGKRFVNETGRRDTISKAALQQRDKQFFIIGTSEASQIDKDGRNKYGVKLEDLVKQKKAFVGNTWDELAQKAGINAENLKKTVADWNKFCNDPKDDPFGRPSCDPEVRLDGHAPYYATIMSPSVHHTMGGVRINKNTQVLDKNGKIIRGLYAAGEVTGGIHGSNRVGGNAVPDALVYGRIAGQEAAK